MKAFIVDRTYRVIDNKSYVYLFGRLENGESFLTINHFKPYFYIKESDLSKANNIAKFDTEKSNMKTISQEAVIKVILDVPKDSSLVRKAFEDQSIPCFEADIKFTQRFLMDKEIFSTLNIEGDFKKGDWVNRIYEEPKLKPTNHDPNLRVLSIDIETAQDMKQLFSIALQQGNKKKVILVDNNYDEEQILQLSSLDYVDIAKSEEEAIIKFKEIFLELDPDILTGWNLIDFDLKVLKELFDKYKIDFKLGRANWPCRLRIESEFFRDSKADFPGRMILDGIHILKSSFIQLDDYKLGTAAKVFLNESKLIEEDNKVQDIIDSYNKNPKKLCEYNLKDADLVLRILKEKKLIDLTILRSKLVGLPLENVRQSIASFDSVYIRRMNKLGLVAPSTLFSDKPESITGGYVMEGVPGIYDNIIVLDFKSLYPSLMRTFNIDPISFQPNMQLENSNDEFVVTPNKAVFKNEQGLLPTILKELWDQRDQAKKDKDIVRSSAIKVLMNSFFGVLASPNCRFFSMEIANAITQTGQFINKLAGAQVEKLGYQVIYADTDSCFVNTKNTNYDEAKIIGEEIEKNINSFFKDHIPKTYHRESFLELELEKIFKVFLMPTTRGGTEGAKKRYAGLLIKNVEGKEIEDIAFTGLEFVRKDWTKVSKKFQLTLLDLIFHKKEITSFVKEFVDDIKSGKYDDLLVYVKSLRKSTKDYTKTTPPHVKAARIIEEHEKIVDNNIYYYITKDGPQPIKYVTSEIDYDHYINKQIKPIADSVLMFYDTNFDDLMRGSKQKTLFGF